MFALSARRACMFQRMGRRLHLHLHLPVWLSVSYTPPDTPSIISSSPHQALAP